MPRPTWVLLSVIKYFKWAHIGIISSSDDTWVETAIKVGMFFISGLPKELQIRTQYRLLKASFHQTICWDFLLKQLNGNMFYIVFVAYQQFLRIFKKAFCLYANQVADALRSHGLPVRLVSYMENTPHGIRRTLSKLRKMKEIRSDFHFWPHVYYLFTHP